MLKILKQFFFSKGNFSPPYFWITVFCLLVVIAVIERLVPYLDKRLDLSDTLLLGMLGFILGWITIYNKFGQSDKTVRFGQIPAGLDLNNPTEKGIEEGQK